MAILRTILIIATLCWLQACSEDGDSVEAQIRDFIDVGVAAAEDRDVGDMQELLHENYRDHKGYNRKQLTSLLRAYFFRHKNIHLFTKIESIDVVAEDQAYVSLYVAMAGTAITGLDALPGLKAQIYRFDLQLIRKEGWQLQHAEYGPASIVDLE